MRFFAKSAVSSRLMRDTSEQRDPSTYSIYFQWHLKLSEAGYLSERLLTMTCRTSSPFWRARTADTRRELPSKKSTRDPGLVVGASYSHADMMRLDNLYESRPVTDAES